MKNYFNFSLTGKKLFPLWILMYVIFVIPYCFVLYQINSLDKELAINPYEIMGQFLLWNFIMILLFLVQYVILFFFAKMTIEGVTYKEKALSFQGSFGQFIGVLVLGYFLSIITCGIYAPWFITKINKYFATNTQSFRL
ncbi:MAG: DUF898 family protein [Paludibacteraceae bacterium]